jgi:hypothetical protein
MIGTGRQFLEAAVSQPDADDSDPLLDFSSEHAADSHASLVTRTSEPTAQTIAPLVDPVPPPAPSIPIDTLIMRIERLETALDDSKIQVSTLKSEVATLVRAIGDIKTTVSDIKKQPPRPEKIRAAVRLPRPARVSRTASVILAALVGLGAGVFGWMYLGGAADGRLGALSQPKPAQETAFVPVDQPVAPAMPPSVNPVPVPVSVASRASADTRLNPNPHVNYVGTLSVDSQPGGEVFLDRKSVGQTPVKLTNLRAGSHLVWVERDGFHRWTRVVQVPADRVSRLFADLEPLSAR